MKNQKHEGYFAKGIQTFMKSKYVSIKDISKYDITFLGIPIEYGASYRKGTALAPTSIRKYSYWDSVLKKKYYNLDENEFIQSHKLNICDIGDIHISPTKVFKNQEKITKVIKKIRKRSFPLIIGGDHSIAYSTIKGCFLAFERKKRKKLGILHIDAHMDIEKSYLDMPDIFHGNPFRKLIKANIIKGNNIYTIGPRGIIPSYLIKYSEKQKINLYPIAKIREIGFQKFVDILIENLNKNLEGVYITLDIDSIDPSQIKGTGTPLENGFLITEMEYLLRKMQKVNIIGFELVELAPDLDESGCSSIFANNLIWHFLSFGFNKENNDKNCTFM